MSTNPEEIVSANESATPDVNSPAPNPQHLAALRRISPALTDDDHHFYIPFREQALAEIAPVGPAELFIAEQIISHRWFLLHADDAEAASMRQVFSVESQRRIDPSIAHYPRDEQDRADRARAATITDKQVQRAVNYRTAHERALFRLERLLNFYRTLREARASGDQKSNFTNTTNNSSEK